VLGWNRHCFSPRPPSWHPRMRSSGRAALPSVLTFVLSLVRIYSFLGQSWAESKGEGQRTGTGQKCVPP